MCLVLSKLEHSSAPTSAVDAVRAAVGECQARWRTWQSIKSAHERLHNIAWDNNMAPLNILHQDFEDTLAAFLESVRALARAERALERLQVYT